MSNRIGESEFVKRLFQRGSRSQCEVLTLERDLPGRDPKLLQIAARDSPGVFGFALLLPLDMPAEFDWKALCCLSGVFEFDLRCDEKRTTAPGHDQRDQPTRLEVFGARGIPPVAGQITNVGRPHDDSAIDAFSLRSPLNTSRAADIVKRNHRVSLLITLKKPGSCAQDVHIDLITLPQVSILMGGQFHP